MLEIGINSPWLKTKCKPVTEITEEIKIILREMEQELKKHKNGMALAANQIGKDLRVIVIYLQGKLWKLINPEIISQEEELIVEEGCLSFPGMLFKIKRYQKITFRALNKKRKMLHFNLTDVEAQCIQHEIDHLDGILLTDKEIK